MLVRTPEKETDTMGVATLTPSEIARRGRELYVGELQRRLELEHTGEFVVIDIETGDFEVDADDVNAFERANARHPDALFYIHRVGFRTAHRFT